MWKPSAVSSCVNNAAAPVTPEALATIATAPSAPNGIVVAVVGGSVVVVVVVVVDVVVVGGSVVVVVVVDEDVVVGTVVVVAAFGGPNVQAASTTTDNTTDIVNSRRAHTRSSCRLPNARTRQDARVASGEPEAT